MSTAASMSSDPGDSASTGSMHRGAVDERRLNDDSALVRALTPTVELAIRTSVRRDPQPLADAIFPVIGPAIRRAIAAAIDGLIESMNRAAELAFSLKALRWRIEAWRTGRSFGEVVIAHRLRYSVEQIFLIQRDSGLLLAHVSRVEAVVPDVVSGMLTAIQEFVRESFSLTSRESLRTLQAGELTVLLEQGPTAVLAAVIRGYAPQAAAVRLQELNESLHRDYGESLEQYDADPITTEGLELQLRDGLVTDLAPLRPRWRLLPITVAVTLVVGAILLWGFASAGARANWNSYVRRVSSTPGLVVIESGRRDGRWFIRGLRDPLASDPQQLLDSSGVQRSAVEARWRPYLSLDPELVLRRRLRDRDLALVDSQARAIAAMLIRFPVGSAQPTADGARVADELVRRLGALVGAAQRADASIDVTTVGSTDTTGTEARNALLASERAAYLRGRLGASAIVSHALVQQARGTMSAAQPSGADARSASVLLEVRRVTP